MTLALSTFWMGVRPYGAAALLEAMRELGLRHCALSRAAASPPAGELARVLVPAGARVVALEFGGEDGPPASDPSPSLVSADMNESAMAVRAARAAIDRAKAAGARHLVLRLGDVQAERTREREDEVWALVRGASLSDEARRQAQSIARQVDARVDAYLDRACRLLFDLAREWPEMRFGVATPDTLSGFPNQRVLPMMLDELKDRNLGYWHDAGAAWRQEALGVCPPGSWAGEGAARMIGATFHDVTGAESHLPPGAGELDFRLLGENLPAGVPLVLEVDPRFPVGEVRLAVSYLRSIGYASP